MLTKNRLLRLAVLASLPAAFHIGSALAQESAQTAAQTGAVKTSDANNAASIDEVVVTGTRIRGAAPVGSSVIAIDREAIAAAPGLTIDRIIKEVPAVYDLGVSEASRGQSGGSGNIVFGNAINLHGIGPYATLTLVDGHRTISDSRSVDPSVIPSLGLERIEIVADGASAVYGSDAVAGVVNLVPRRHLNGVDATVHYGAADAFHEYQAGIAGGKVWNDGQVMVAYERSFRSNLNGDDRDFFTSDQRRFGGADYRGTNCNPGTLNAGGVNYAIPAGGVTQATVGSLVAGTRNLCDVGTGQDLLPEQKYDSLNATFNQHFNDWLELFADGFYSKRTYAIQPAQTEASIAVPNTNAFFVAVPGAPTTGNTIGYNYGGDLPINAQTGSAESWEVTPGLRFSLPHDFRLDVLYTYGKNDDEANSTLGLNNAALATALASGDPALAFDPYGLHRTSAATLALLANQIFLAPTLNTFQGYEARLDGSVFSLPGGDVRIATGYEGQDMHVALGTARGNPTNPIVFRNFSRQVNSGYLELFVPIFGSGNALPGANRLEFTAAVRYDNYSDVGSTTNPKFGLNWSPIASLKFRGSYGTSFRAPLISEIYGNSNGLYGQNYQNPAGGAPLLGFALSGGNTDLKPEEATTWSFGVDWDATDTTHLSATYFDVKYEKQVTNYLSNLGILSLANQFTGTGIILTGTDARDRVLALLAQGITLARGSFPGGDPNNVTLFIDGRNNNLGTSITRGIDLQATQHWTTNSLGDFKLSLGGSYFTEYEVALTAAGARTDRLNTIFNPLRFRGRLAGDWNYGPVATELTLHYVTGYDNNLVTPVQRVSAYTPVDLSVNVSGDSFGWLGSFGSNFTVGLEVTNLFNENPPYVNIAQSGNGGGGFDPTASDPIGRLIGLRVSKSWR